MEILWQILTAMPSLSGYEVVYICVCVIDTLTHTYIHTHTYICMFVCGISPLLMRTNRCLKPRQEHDTAFEYAYFNWKTLNL